MKSRAEFIKLEKGEEKKIRAKKKAVFWFISLVILGLVYGWMSMNSSTYELASNAAGSLELKGAEKQLHEISLEKKWENEARAAFGAEVVWIEVPAASTEEFTRIAMRFLDDGVGLSFSNSPNKGMIRSCVSKPCARKLMFEIPGAVMMP